MQSVELQKTQCNPCPGWHQERKKRRKRKSATERGREIVRERERGQRVEKKTTTEKAVQRSLTSFGQNFSSPSLHFVLHFCVLKTFFSRFSPLALPFSSVSCCPSAPRSKWKKESATGQHRGMVGCKSAPWTGVAAPDCGSCSSPPLTPGWFAFPGWKQRHALLLLHTGSLLCRSVTLGELGVSLLLILSTLPPLICVAPPPPPPQPGLEVEIR